MFAPLIVAMAEAPHPAKLVGIYDGGQMEIAAALQLTKEGRFRYRLSYGALDEVAEGSWSVSNGMVNLVVEQFESSMPSEGGPGLSSLRIADDTLLLYRHDRALRFRKR